MIDNDYKRKREIRKENFEYLKFNNILNKVENSIIWILEELKINPKIMKSKSIKYLIELLKTIISENDDLKTMETKIIKNLKIENRIVIFSDDEYDYVWEVLESPPDGVSFKKIYKKKKGTSLYIYVEEIIFNKNSRETQRKYLDRTYENDAIIVDAELNITNSTKNGYKINIINIKNNYDNNILEFIIENEQNQILDKQKIIEYLDKNNITYYRRILKNINEKIYPEEKIILSEYSKAVEERTNSVRERGGFFRTRFDSAETDD